MNTQSFGSRLFKIAIFILIVLIAAIIALQLYQAEWKKSAETELRFESTELPFIQEVNSKNMLPFLGLAAFDADGDGIDESFLGGGLKAVFTANCHERSAFYHFCFIALDNPKADKHLKIRRRNIE